MNTLLTFSRILLENIQYIFPVILIFLLISLVGIFLFLWIVEEDGWSIIVPAGAITGVTSFIFFLSFFSYLFRGRGGILFIFLSFLLVGFFIGRGSIKYLPKFKILSKNKPSLPLSIYLILSIFLFLTAGINGYGGDVTAYWGFATSFANGNYPLRSPWQPDLLANHHQGTFIFEGAVHALSGADISTVHSLFSAFIIAAGLFLLWGIVKKLTGLKFLSIIPAFVVYISYGAIFIPLPQSIRSLFNPEVEHIVSRLPIMSDAKNRLGGSSNLNELFYINHRATAFAGLFFIVYLMICKLRVSDFWRPSLIAFLSIPAISSDEIILPAVGMAAIAWSVQKLVTDKKLNIGNFIKSVLIAIILFIVVFFVVGSALRDSILTPSSEAPRFQILTDLNKVLGRANGMREAILRINNSEWMIYIPDLRIIMSISLIAAFLLRDLWLRLLVFGGLGTVFAYFTVEHTFYPGNEGRLLHLLYILFGLTLSYALIKVLSLGRSRMFLRILSLIGLILFIPALLSSFGYLLPKIIAKDYPNFYGKTPDYSILKWVRQNLSHERVFFIEKFPEFAALSNKGVQNYGLLVPVSPAKYKVHTPDWGPEAFDLMRTLSPKAIKDLKLRYIFITHEGNYRLPQKRKNDLKNPAYFIPIQTDSEGILYKVRDNYLQSEAEITGSLTELENQINNNAKIYFDYPPILHQYIRAVLLLLLKDKGIFYTEWRAGAFNYIETKLQANLPDKSIKYDYMILGESTDPLLVCNCDQAELIWKSLGVKAFRTVR